MSSARGVKRQGLWAEVEPGVDYLLRFCMHGANKEQRQGLPEVSQTNQNS